MTKQRKAPANTSHNAVPPVAQETALRLEAITDRAAFQSLCDAVLSSHFGYRMHPRGVSPRGTVVGRPDSWGHDTAGNLCAFEYGTDRNWRAKLEEDLKSVAGLAGEDFAPTVFVFCTNRHVDATVERSLRAQVHREYGWELRLFSGIDLANVLDTDLQDVRHRYLGMRISRHTWPSLLAACEEQRRSAVARYTGKYDPALYVERRCENTVDEWYRHAADSTAQGKPRAELLAIVDQAGAGKSNLALHLAERYGKRGPAILLPGSLAIPDDHTIEREVVAAVGYVVDDRSYQTDLTGLCRLAQEKGRPLLVILDGVNERQDPERVRGALAHLLAAYRDKPLLVLMTCRDAVWHHLTDPLWRGFAYQPGQDRRDDVAIPLGLYDDSEFRTACDRYFARWAVEATLGPKATRVLRSPLMLRIFAEVHRGRRLGHVPEIVASDLWGAYHERKIRDIYEGVNRRLREATIAAAVERIAMCMLDHGGPALDINDLDGIRGLDIDDNSPTSLFIRLKDACVLLEDPPGTVRFVHEPFLEFVLGRALARDLEQSAKRAEALECVASLAAGDRWRHVPLHVAALAADAVPVIERIRTENLWLATLAVLRRGSRVPAVMRSRIIEDLVAELDSRYMLDRMRAAELLGRLRAIESLGALRQLWRATNSATAIRALVRLGVDDVIDGLILYLGRQQSWYRDDDQELVDALSPTMRRRLRDRAVALLSSDHRTAAAHALGYLYAEDAVALLRAELESQDWTDHVGLKALLRIGTPEALDTLEYAVERLGARALEIDAKMAQARRNGDKGTEKALDEERHRYLWPLTELRVYGLQHTTRTKVVPFLRRFIQHPNRYIMHEVLASLENIGVEDAGDVVLDIIRSAALVGEDWYTLMELQRTVVAMGRQLHANALVTLLRDDDVPATVKESAVAALGATGDPRALAPLTDLVERGQFTVAAIQALGKLGDPGALSTLTKLLQRGDHIGEDRRVALERELAVEALGRLHDSGAYAPLEGYARVLWPNVPRSLVEALVASGRERAIPLLVELWAANRDQRRAILSGLLWIGTEAATSAILELLGSAQMEDVALLANALFHDERLFHVGGGLRPRVDDRIVALIETSFDQLAPAQQQVVLWALGHIASERALLLLERVAGDATYDVPVPRVGPGETQTVRRVAVGTLRQIGSAATVDVVLDDLVGRRAGFAVYDLDRIDRGTVLGALRSRLSGAEEPLVVRLLELLGWYGDETVLADIRPYCHDVRSDVANAAYEAEQRILGLADLVFTHPQ